MASSLILHPASSPRRKKAPYPLKKGYVICHIVISGYRIFCSCLHQYLHLQERLAQLLADSLDVLESEDTLELLVAVCRSDQDESNFHSLQHVLLLGKGWPTY